MDFHKIYKPITAAPFTHDKSYTEIEPCEALKPYIRCFWGSEKPYKEGPAEELANKLVVPDTCMDIIFRINFTNNRLESSFCGINDVPFTGGDSTSDHTVKSVFGIRFYAWSAVLFSEESMQDVKNGFYDVGQYFSKIKKALEQQFFEVVDLRQRVEIAQKILLQHLREKYQNPLITEAIGEILTKRGNIKLSELSREVHVSERQLERLFKEYVGISPKQLSSLIRYQYLWNDFLFNSGFHIQDGVYRYGYTDQSHLLRDFKRFHTMNLAQAKEFAFHDVAFLQEM
ncbi:MAG: helix-turn-helix domain-containing protein [Lachnospiraceae bacterium]|nr:helix-turn-helix domain-containing protein [Lachnospiraceae bacterium]